MMRSTRWLDGSPELVIEVKSPSNGKTELQDKAMTTLAGGAGEFWIVDYEKRTVTVYSATAGMLLYTTGTAVPVPLFNGRVELDKLFDGI
jgi:Uma2 family endonuclease